MALLKATALTKRFGGLAANNAIDLEVPEGSLFAVIGPNGAGKTTFFNMVSGFLSSTSGSIELDGRDVTQVPQHEIAGMGLVRTFQLVQLFNGMSVAENVEVGCHLATRGGVAASLFRPKWFRKQEVEVRERAMELLDFVGREPSCRACLQNWARPPQWCPDASSSCDAASLQRPYSRSISQWRNFVSLDDPQ